MLREAVQSKYMDSPFSIYKNFIWDSTNYILYSATDWKIVWSYDEKKTEIEEKIKDKLEKGWTIDYARYDNDYRKIEVTLSNEDKFRYVSYSYYDGFTELFDGLQLDN